jgi:dCMP deaminase
MDSLLKWDLRFMSIARSVSSWSKDPSTKVGAVLTKRRKIVATGYNGFPGRIKDDNRLNDREFKYPRIIHAEMNSLLQAGHNTHDSTLYLYGMPGPPCSNCTKHIIEAGICRIVTRRGTIPESWRADFKISMDMLSEADIPISHVEFGAP